MNFRNVNSSSDLILANYNWWKNKGSLSENNPFSCYDRDEIIKENSYNDNVIIELNKYMITNDSQCGLSEDTFTPYHEACLDQRSETLDIPVNILRKAVVRVEQRAYVSGFMTLATATHLSSILNKSKRNFSYIIFRPTIGDTEFFSVRVPLTTEIIKLESRKQIKYNFKNCPKIKSLLKYTYDTLDHIKSRLPKSKGKYVDELVRVKFIMNNFCEKGLMEELVDLFKLI